MQLEKLILKKEEIPVLYENCFQIPIHPRLLNPNIKIDKDLAKKVFPKATEEWYYDLVRYSKTLKEEKSRKWINEVFLKKKPRIKKEYNSQVLDTLYWKDEVFTLENGFASSLSISRNTGGTLYLNRNEMGGKAFVSFNDSVGYIRFPKNKALEFGIENRVIKLGNGVEGVEVYVYDMHNIDYYPGALFLRNWALLYLNKAIKQFLD